ncbi:14138_t:CDS:2, partial [Rhizophagus irregularis]
MIWITKVDKKNRMKKTQPSGGNNFRSFKRYDYSDQKRGNQRYYDREYGEDKGNSREDRGKQGPNVKFFRGERSQNQRNEQNNNGLSKKEEEKGDEGKVGGVKKKRKQLDTNDNNNNLERNNSTTYNVQGLDFKDYQAFNSCNDKAKEGVTILVNRKHLANHMYGKQNRIINWLVKNKFVDPAFIKYGEITDDMITWKSGGNQEFDYKLIKVYLLDQTDQAFTWSGYQKTKGGEVNDRKKVVEKWEEFENIITEEWINRLEMDY